MSRKSKISDDEFTREFIQEAELRVTDIDNPIRYVIYSEILPERRWRLFYDVSRDAFCNDLDSATMLK